MLTAITDSQFYRCFDCSVFAPHSLARGLERRGQGSGAVLGKELVMLLRGEIAGLVLTIPIPPNQHNHRGPLLFFSLSINSQYGRAQMKELRSLKGNANNKRSMGSPHSPANWATHVLLELLILDVESWTLHTQLPQEGNA
jgi:hypothetical protein